MSPPRHPPRALVVVPMIVLAASAAAEVRPAAIFADHMVLQRGRGVPVWGTAKPGETVTVSLGAESATTEADGEGRWRVVIGPFEAREGAELVLEGENRLVLRDVAVGEVWVCSGQSNMEWPVRRAARADEEIARADHPRLRFFVVRKTVAGEPLSDAEGRWEPCRPETAADFSAVAYFFGRDLVETLGVPVGLVQSAWGGTPAEAWTPRGALEAQPACRPILERWEESLAQYPDARRRFDEEIARWREAVEKARSEDRPEPRRPADPRGPEHPHRPSGLWNGMVAPIVPFGIRGAIWYQGESNAARAHQYRTLFPALVRAWRDAWGEGDFPFLFVQLANFRVAPGTAPGTWAELREAQGFALDLPNTAMAVAIDIGDPGDIHPKNKQEVGRRLALAAKALAYGMEVVHSGPVYREMRVEGGEIRIHFDHLGGGLVAEGGALRGFEIAAEDRRFVPARAEIEGETVVIRSSEVPRPVSVRYAWADDPEGTLFNRSGLPASPFRTDDWPGVTVEAR